MKSKFAVFFCVLFVLSSLAVAVNAQEEEGIFGAVLRPMGNISAVYARYGAFVDAVIYLIIFLGLAQVTIGKKFGKEGKAVTVGVGLVLAIGLALFEARAGFNIASFGPIAVIILLALMGYAMWFGIKSLEIEGVDNITMVAVTYILVYFGISATVPNVMEWLNRNVSPIGALLALLAVVFLIFLIYKVIVMVMNLFKGAPAGEVEEAEDRTAAAFTPAGKRKKPSERKPHPLSELRVVEGFIVNAMRGLGSAKRMAEKKDKKVTGKMKSSVENLNNAIAQARRIQHTAKYRHIRGTIESIRNALEAVRDNAEDLNNKLPGISEEQISQVAGHIKNNIRDPLAAQLEAVRRLRKARGVAAPK